MTARAYVLMTAMPPTKGHLHLIQFAEQLGSTAEVIVCTQPDEPYALERVQAIRDATVNMRVNVHHIHEELPQEPAVAIGFWDMWLGFLRTFGLRDTDYIVASEMYGSKLAEISGATFVPYDLERAIYYSRATDVRGNPRRHFDSVLPEFQPKLRQRVTVFGAESVGKTVLSRSLAQYIDGHWLPEWARPYLESTGLPISVPSMTTIWQGQKALQSSGALLLDKPFIVQDTDLFSTLGFWKNWNREPPAALYADADNDRSDLYIVLRSNIPFEPDPLRFGGDERETSDEFWIEMCENFDLPFVVLDSVRNADRIQEAATHVFDTYNRNVQLGYVRAVRPG